MPGIEKYRCRGTSATCNGGERGSHNGVRRKRIAARTLPSSRGNGRAATFYRSPVFSAEIKSSGANLERSFSLYSISPRSRSPIEASQARHRRERLLRITRRFFFDAFTQGVKLLLRDPVNFGGNFHYGHGEKLCRKAQMQFVREVDMLLQRPCD